MDKDDRYEATLIMWQYGKVKIFSELFKWMPKTLVAKDMKVDVRRLTACIEDPTLVTSKDLDKLSDLYMIRRSAIRDLIQSQLKAQKKAKGLP